MDPINDFEALKKVEELVPGTIQKVTDNFMKEQDLQLTAIELETMQMNTRHREAFTLRLMGMICTVVIITAVLVCNAMGRLDPPATVQILAGIAGLMLLLALGRRKEE